MRNDRHIAVIAAVLLVTLRLAIGWQLLYEGLWKIDTQKTTTPWTAAGYLRNSQGPFRGMFRAMAGDPDDLDWLDVKQMGAKWDAWEKRFAEHYKLDKANRARLHELVNGSKSFEADLEKLPEGIDFAALRLDKRISYNAEKKRLVVSPKFHLTPKERDKLLAAIDDEAEGAGDFRKAVGDVYKRGKAKMGAKKQMMAALANPDVRSSEEAQRVGELEKYRLMLARYEEGVHKADQDFRWDHLSYSWGEIQALRSKLVAPIKAIDQELKKKANELLTVEQLNRGAAPKAWSPLRVSDMLTIAGLTILGLMLIFGLGTRFAALMAAFMLFMFYAAMPPWPGVPEAPGPEHSFIVNKNFIEIVALLAIAALPTGRWCGLDGAIAYWFAKRQEKLKEAAPA